MTVTIRSALNPERMTLSEEFEQCDGRQVLKRQFKMVIVNGRHWHQAIQTLCREDDPQWT